MAPRLVGLVADDLTGAMDAAVQFAVEGCAAHVLCNPAAQPEVEGAPCLLAVVTGVRAAGDDEAAAGTAGAVGGLLARGCDRLYIKVDSTMRGSVAGQLRGALAMWTGRYPGAVIVLCPAFPAERRAVVGGTVLLDGIPLDRTAVATDPITPVVERRLDRLVPGASAAVLSDLPSAASASLGGRQAGRVVFVDASTDADLDEIAAAVGRLGPQGVAAGAAGLARATARAWCAGSRRARTAVQPSARILIGVSSLHSTARESLRRLRASFADDDGGAPAVDVMSTRTRRRTDAAAVAASFGEQVAGRLAGGSYDTLILVGGDGAAAVLDRTGADAIRVHSALAPGIPVGTIIGGEAHGVRVVTTSGGFGDSDSLLRIIDHLQSSPSVRKERP